MHGPIASLNGDIIPASRAAVSVADMGLVHGVAVSEVLRTFRHRPFRASDHIKRFHASANAVGITVPVNAAELSDTLDTVVAHNSTQLDARDDLGVTVFASAGLNATYVGQSIAADTPATLCVHTFPLPFELWAEATVTGLHLATSLVPALPPECVPPAVKSRSRMHWHLADRDVRARHPRARALLLNQSGEVTETATANIFAVNDDVIRTPPDEVVLAGVSRTVVRELASSLGMEFETSPLKLEDLLAADEVFTSSTPYCLLPVSKVNETGIGNECPGPMVRRLWRAWSEMVQLDFIEQARTADSWRSREN